MKKVAVILSGCGYKDGTEITEAVSLIITLSKFQIQSSFFALNKNINAIDHTNDQTNEESQRNILSEATRITREPCEDLKNIDINQFDGIAFPGGFGAATHLCDFAQKGAECSVDLNIQKIIEQFHLQSKPIFACCIAPALIAKVLGQHKITVTIGDDKETAQAIEQTGAQHKLCSVTDYVFDKENKIITTPAFMYDTSPSDVFIGISKGAESFIQQL